ncbi:cytochrome C oxidase subunit II [Aureimonas ureilytica]|uniref:Cytochrome aa3 subunit 2 n=1 Tax=Aureimonas ureilytica TaxID=401562 RepID=A0A175R904_9HYPH|nr:cytochrome c oxidase subunit II [Aureimonas ureilytica]KTQ95758.1 cytochrome C oxidase subunit II [Aureimonas ureilytica]
MIAPLALSLGLSGCAGKLSILDPAGPAAQSTATLWWVMLSGATAILALVLALVAFAFLRPGWGQDIPPKRWLVWGGLVFPGVVLTALLVFALATGERLLAHPGAPGLVRVEARPYQWRWEFRYPGREGATETVLHVPAGQPIDVAVIGTDVIHAFWVPRLGGKIDAIPGHVNVIRLQADRPGTYGGVCAEFCGRGHAEMSFSVIAHPPENFEAALDQALAAAPAPSLSQEPAP